MTERIKMNRVALCMTVAVLSTPCAEAALVAYWTFDSGDATDCVGVSHGTFESDVRWVDGHHGGACEFDGEEDHIDYGARKVFDIVDEITLAAWICVPVVDDRNHTIIGKGNSSWRIRVLPDRRIHFAVTGGPPYRYVDGDSYLPSEGWHHVCGTYDGMQMRIYLDGQCDASKTCTGPMTLCDQHVYVGANAEHGCFFRGIIDEVMVFDHALKPAEVSRLFHGGGEPFLLETRNARRLKKAQEIADMCSPEEAESCLRKMISDERQWRVNGLSSGMKQGRTMLPDLYFLLAQAQERAGRGVDELIGAYRHVVTDVRYESDSVPRALAWLSRHLSNEEYSDIAKEFVESTEVPLHCARRMTLHFEANESWEAFEVFLDAMFSHIRTNPDVLCRHADVIARTLSGNTTWSAMFSAYCLGKPEFLSYLFFAEEKRAKACIARKDYREAIRIYREIADRCHCSQGRPLYDFKVCQLLFTAHEYEGALCALVDVIENHRATMSQVLMAETCLLRAKCLIRLDRPDQAARVLLNIPIEFAESHTAAEAAFVLGYSQLLYGNFPEATEAFGVVVSEYPESEYAARSSLYLDRIACMVHGEQRPRQ